MFSSVVLAASYLAKRDRAREAGDGSVLATLQPPTPGLPARLGCRGERPEAADSVACPPRNCSIIPDKRFSIRAVSCCRPRQPFKKSKSEEHTSELQSRENLVCRLLLEKKKQSMRYSYFTISLKFLH